MAHGWGRHIEELTLQDLTAFNKVYYLPFTSALFGFALNNLSDTKTDYQLTNVIAPPTQYTNIPNYTLRYEDRHVSRLVSNKPLQGLPRPRHQSGRRYLHLHSGAGHHHWRAVQPASRGDDYLPRECRTFACRLEHCVRLGSGCDAHPYDTQIGHLDKAEDLSWVSPGCGFFVSIFALLSSWTFATFGIHKLHKKIVDPDTGISR